MIILDTSLLSELMKPAPAAKVVDWVASQAAPTLYTTVGVHAAVPEGGAGGDGVIIDEMVDPREPIDRLIASRPRLMALLGLTEEKLLAGALVLGRERE